jgi:hypothetical protein
LLLLRDCGCFRNETRSSACEAPVILKRARPTRRRGPRPLGLSQVHRLLSNPYYAGFVKHNGHVYEGRHERLVSQELFDKVQAVLVAHRHSGERDRKHQHYLKGTIRCGTCGSQLVYSRNNGNGGTYSSAHATSVGSARRATSP